MDPDSGGAAPAIEDRQWYFRGCGVAVILKDERGLLGGAFTGPRGDPIKEATRGP